MAELRSKPLIILKGVLFLAILVCSAVLLWAEAPTWQTAGLIALLVWSSARFYYFLFYVLERYVDPRLKYAGLCALFGALLRRAYRDR
ncbi:MAG: hypothetical protein D6725_08275 [Planctomycetota bacterium]|nr:MAG: hypothetical protein D6725_08275 [Planctomycetota bacterium]